MCDGALVAYLRRGNPNVQVFLPEEEPQRSQVARSLAEFLVGRVQEERWTRMMRAGGMLIATVNGVPVAEHAMARVFAGCGVCGGCDGVQCAEESATVARATEWSEANA